MRKLFLNLYYWPTFLLITLFGLVVLPGILLVNGTVYRRSIASGLRRAIRVYGWVLVKLVPFFGPIRVEYACRQMPRPAILVANHNSAIDPYLFGAIAIENGFVTSWPFKIPVYNFLMRLAGYANTDEGWHEVRCRSKAMLDQGSSVTIWPEGHRSRNGAVGRFKNGAFSLAVETGVPVIPVCILGSADVLAPGERFLNPARVRLIVLDPVYPEPGKKEPEDIKELRNRVRAQIEETLSENGHFRFIGRSRRSLHAGEWTKSLHS